MTNLLFDKHLTHADLEAGIDLVLSSPKNMGSVEMIVRRPAVNQREVIDVGVLDVENGMVGDNWVTRGSSRSGDGKGHPEMQLNIMNYRFAELIAGHRERVPLAGDQLFVDLDLSPDNLPPGTRLSISSAVIEVTAIPHLGCKKFVERFGLEAMKFANSGFGRTHNLRGINAKVVSAGNIAVGDTIEIVR
ncbi:MAG: MOSC domain-containing protein [Pyrinomonadaceae bacterium]